MSNFGESEKTRFTQKAKERKEKHLDGRKVSLFRGKTENGQEMDVTLGIAVSRNAGGGKREREKEKRKNLFSTFFADFVVSIAEEIARK